MDKNVDSRENDSDRVIEESKSLRLNSLSRAATLILLIGALSPIWFSLLAELAINLAREQRWSLLDSVEDLAVDLASLSFVLGNISVAAYFMAGYGSKFYGAFGAMVVYSVTIGPLFAMLWLSLAF